MLRRLAEHKTTVRASASASATAAEMTMAWTLDMYGNAWRLGAGGGIELQRAALRWRHAAPSAWNVLMHCNTGCG